MKGNTNSKKRVLITGASSGIGFELAKLYGKNGYDLILVARRNDKLDHLKKDIESAFGVDVIELLKESFSFSKSACEKVPLIAQIVEFVAVFAIVMVVYLKKNGMLNKAVKILIRK